MVLSWPGWISDQREHFLSWNGTKLFFFLFYFFLDVYISRAQRHYSSHPSDNRKIPLGRRNVDCSDAFSRSQLSECGMKKYIKKWRTKNPERYNVAAGYALKNFLTKYIYLHLFHGRLEIIIHKRPREFSIKF